jgi:hypothetical protein
LLAECLRRARSHSSAQNNLAVAEQAGNARVTVSAVSMKRLLLPGLAVLADPLGMRRLIVGSQFAVLNAGSFNFKNDESGTLAKMLGYGYSIHCRNCYFHVHPLILYTFNFALVCSSGTSAAVLLGHSFR